MRRNAMAMAGGTTLAVLGALVGFAIGSGNRHEPLLAQRRLPVEVRTEIVRKTINIYRREHPHHPAGGWPPPGSVAAGSSESASLARTGSSGSRAAASAPSAAWVLSTRSSGRRRSARAPAAAGQAPANLRTRSSGASTSGSGAARPVRTSTSGRGGERDDGAHDD